MSYCSDKEPCTKIRRVALPSQLTSNVKPLSFPLPPSSLSLSPTLVNVHRRIFANSEELFENNKTNIEQLMGETERRSNDKVKLLEKTVELINQQQVNNAKIIAEVASGGPLASGQSTASGSSDTAATAAAATAESKSKAGTLQSVLNRANDVEREYRKEVKESGRVKRRLDSVLEGYRSNLGAMKVKMMQITGARSSIHLDSYKSVMAEPRSEDVYSYLAYS